VSAFYPHSIDEKGEREGGGSVTFSFQGKRIAKKEEGGLASWASGGSLPAARVCRVREIAGERRDGRGKLLLLRDVFIFLTGTLSDRIPRVRSEEEEKERITLERE